MAMELVKLNVLHLHLSDNEGFRVESKVFPKLQDSGSEGQFYSQDDIRKIVEYARDRGVRVVPEFDVPGHTRSWLTGYPELGSGGILAADREAGLRISRPAVRGNERAFPGPLFSCRRR